LSEAADGFDVVVEWIVGTWFSCMI